MRTSHGIRIISIAFLITLFMVLAAKPAAAQATGSFGTPAYYLVTVKNCQISADAGTTWTTLWTTGIPMDIASVAPLTKVGDFLANQAIETGTYNRFRCTIDQTMVIRGTVSHGGDTYYTKNALNDSTTAPAVDSTVVIPTGDQTFTQTINLAVTGGGVASNIQINFNLTNAIQLYLVAPGVYKIYPEAPSITFTCNGGPC